MEAQAALARWLIILIGIEAGFVTAFFGLLTTQRDATLGWTSFLAGSVQVTFALFCLAVSGKRMFRR